MVEDARRRSAEIFLDHPVAVDSATCRMDSELPCKEGCGLEWWWNNKDPPEAHTRDKAPNKDVGFLERVLVRALGHKDADIITVLEDGSVRYNGS